jgi:hypothetical protein
MSTPPPLHTNAGRPLLLFSPPSLKTDAAANPRVLLAFSEPEEVKTKEARRREIARGTRWRFRFAAAAHHTRL